MVLSVDELPGIGDDFEAAARNLNASHAESILLLLLANVPGALTELGFLNDVADLEPRAFIDWVHTLDATEIAAHAHRLDPDEDGTQRQAVQSPPMAQADSPAVWLRSQASETQLESVRQLLANPAALKELTSQTLETFWTDYFQAVYQRHAAAMVNAVDRLQHHEQLEHVLPSLEKMLGRPIGIAESWLNEHDHVLLVPFPFMGPYIMSMASQEPETVVLLAFDAERIANLPEKNVRTLDIAKLKALADETRLKILRFVSQSERFGGEIVTHLQISQPGVSRHLRLLKASGLLTVRQEGTSKYYSVCNDELEAIADGIRQMKSDSRERTKDAT